MDVVVTGIGFVSALGSLTESWQNLLALKSGIRLSQPFLELPPCPLGMLGEQPANLNQLTQLLVREAIADAGLTTPLPECGVVIGSSRSCQGDWEQLIRNQGSLESWWETLPQQPAITTAPAKTRSHRPIWINSYP